MKKLIALCLSVLLLVSLAACASTTGKLEKIKNKGTLIVYTDANFNPFEFTGPSGGPEGVDMEIAKAIADELGVKLEIKEAGFDSILMSLKGGKGDIAISGFTITEDRKKNVDFSDPYINSVQYLLLPEGSSLATVEDLAGRKVGVASGYTGQLLLDYEMGKDEEENDVEDYVGVLFEKGTTVNQYASAMEAVLDMNNGKIEAVVMDEYVAKNIANKNSGIAAKELRYANGDLAAEEYGVALPKGNPELLDVINTVLQRLLSENKIEQWVLQFSE